MLPTPDDFIEAARGYIGTKWRHQGRNRMGIDCVGLVISALADIGVEATDMQGYRRSPDPLVFLDHIRQQTTSEVAPAPGMLGIFRDGIQPCHVGIFTEKHGQLHLLHAYAAIPIVMEEPFIHDWPNLLMEVRRLKGLVY